MYNWTELKIYEKHCYCMGIDILTHELIATGEKIQLPFIGIIENQNFSADLSVYKIIVEEKDCKYTRFNVGDVLYIAKNDYIYPKFKNRNFVSIDTNSFKLQKAVVK